MSRIHNVRRRRKSLDGQRFSDGGKMSKRPAYQDWKKVKFRKQENRVRGEHDFSIRLEATKKGSVQTGQTPRPNAPRPPQTRPSALRAQTRGGPKTPECSQQVAPSTDISQTRRLARAQATSTPLQRSRWASCTRTPTWTRRASCPPSRRRRSSRSRRRRWPSRASRSSRALP